MLCRWLKIMNTIIQALIFVKKYIDQLLSNAMISIPFYLLVPIIPWLKIKYSNISLRPAIVSQGEIVGTSLVDYLQRHPEIENRCSKMDCEIFINWFNNRFWSAREHFFIIRPYNRTCYLSWMHFAAHVPIWIEGLAAKIPVDFAAGLINYLSI